MPFAVLRWEPEPELRINASRKIQHFEKKLEEKNLQEVRIARGKDNGEQDWSLDQSFLPAPVRALKTNLVQQRGRQLSMLRKAARRTCDPIPGFVYDAAQPGIAWLSMRLAWAQKLRSAGSFSDVALCLRVLNTAVRWKDVHALQEQLRLREREVRCERIVQRDVTAVLESIVNKIERKHAVCQSFYLTHAQILSERMRFRMFTRTFALANKHTYDPSCFSEYQILQTLIGQNTLMQAQDRKRATLTGLWSAVRDARRRDPALDQLNRPLSTPFQRLPCRETYPQYYAVAVRPVALEDMARKINSGQ